MAKPDWTPTQKRLLALLADGMPHPREQLQACLYDEMGALSNIRFHVSLLRKKLHGEGQGIVCEIVHRRICYRQIRLLNVAANP